MLRLEITSRDSAPPNLREGQLLSATVQQSRGDGSLILELGGRKLEVRSNLRLLEGMILMLRVEREAGQLVLRLDAQQAQQLSQEQAMRQLLPRQDSLKPLFEQLVQQGIRPLEADGKGLEAARSTQQLTQSLAPLLKLLPTLQQLSTSQGLQQALLNSGLFLENRLALPAGHAGLDSDVKNILLRITQLIRQELQNAPKSGAQAPRQTAIPLEQLQTLLRQSESSVARLQLNQLLSLASTQQRSDERILHVELPMYWQAEKEAEVLRLRIRHKRRQQTSDTSLWSVRIQLAPEGYGQITSIISLIGGKISANFWCSERHTLELFREQLNQLDERFTEQGLETGKLQAHLGEPPAETTEQSPHTPQGLIDLQV